MPLPDFLIDRYKDWKTNTFPKNKSHYSYSETVKQKPRAMIISCCDSRVLETSFFSANIGDFFIHKNIANIVPPSNFDNNESAAVISALEYGILSLEVPDLIIIGHSSCGGIKYSYDKNSKNQIDTNFEYTNNWIKYLKPTFHQLPKKISEKEKITLFEKENIKSSIVNLETYPFIKNKIVEKKLRVHGLWFQIKTGSIEILDTNSGKFEDLNYL